jgi:CHAT domain-containing protein
VEDGILTAYEAQTLDLRGCELVTLSACDTGLGKIKSGEGVYGLQRAIQAAGAHYILMSLWAVDDEATRFFMTSFYRSWLGGRDIPSAYHEAQMQTRGIYPAPKYWAAFALIAR